MIFRIPLLALGLAVCASDLHALPTAEAEQDSRDGHITVTGYATVEVESDVFALTGDLFQHAESRDMAIAAIAEQNQRVRDELPLLTGLKQIELSNTELNIATLRPAGCDIMSYGVDEVPTECEPIAYTAAISFSVTGSPATEAGNVMSYLSEIGVERTRLSEFTVANPEEAKAKAETMAVRDALRKARALAEGVDARIGEIVELTDGTETAYRDRKGSELFNTQNLRRARPVVDRSASTAIAVTPKPQVFSARTVLRVELIDK